MKKALGIVIFILLVGGTVAFFVLSGPQSGKGPLAGFMPGPRPAGSSDRGPAAGVAGANGQSSLKELPVKTVQASEGDIEEYIRISGNVQAASTVNVMPDVNGEVTVLNVRPGDYVQKDVTLAKVDPSRPGVTYTLSPVTSPISGTVTDVLAEVGETVSSTVPIVEIGQLNRLEIQTFVSERYVNRVALGQQSRIKLAALPDTTLQARVSEISPVVNENTRTMEVTLSFDSSTTGVKAGMLAEVILVIEKKSQVVLVPAESIFERRGEEYVFSVQKGNVHMQPVESGIQSDGMVEILSGVQVGEQIVVSGGTRLAEGTPVKVVGREDYDD